jgi:RNA polymerase sigma factor (sigma-70 family)
VEATAGTTRRSPSPSGSRPDPGAAAAFVEELFTSYGRTVLGLCRLLLRDPAEAEDAAQATFVSAHRALLSGAVPRDPPAWLAAIARNECRARARARMREPLALADVPDPLASAIDAGDLDAIWSALAQLPRRQRKAFLLREVGGLSYRELGVALGVTRPAVESLLFRARQQLRSLAQGFGAAFAPFALRDQLARLLPDYGSAASVPLAAKVAAVTAGVGLGAAGVVAFPHDQHARRAAVHDGASRTRPARHHHRVVAVDEAAAPVSQAATVQPRPAVRAAPRRREEADRVEPRHRDEAPSTDDAAAPPPEPVAEPAEPAEQVAEESEGHNLAQASSEGEGGGGSGGDDRSGSGSDGDSGPSVSASHDGESGSGHD